MSDADLTPYSNQDNSSPEALPDENLTASPEALDRAPAPEEEAEEPETERVSKLIAKAGIASRRAAEEMIAAGRVSVNGHVITEQGLKADPYNDRIVVDGQPLRVSEKPGVVIVFHKPRLVMTTRDDPGGRPTVMDYVPRKWKSLHPVGRLDFDTSGVLLLTDDGELTHLLTHPSHGAEKVYEARVRGTVEPAAIEKLERGIMLEDGPTAPCRAKVMAQRDKNALIQLVIREGRNRQVRRMLKAVGHPVNALRRISFAGVELEGLPAGEYRVLLSAEVKALRKRVEEKKKKLSAPKGKFSKPKLPKAEDKKVDAKDKTASEPREGSRRRNAPVKPAAPLERKGSKARALADAQKKGQEKARAKRARNSAASRESAAPRDAAPAPRKPRADRAPVSERVEKRWKS